MIGQNDIADEVFGLDDAHQLVAFAELHHLGRVSMWSANRDQDCGPNYPNRAGRLRCLQRCRAIARRVRRASSARSRAAPKHASPPPARRRPRRRPRQQPRPPPASSTTRRPRPTRSGTSTSPTPRAPKIVWHRNVYQAKWYTTGDQPDIPVATADLTPWTLIGPVLPGETPAPTPTLAGGHLPGVERDGRLCRRQSGAAGRSRLPGEVLVAGHNAGCAAEQAGRNLAVGTDHRCPDRPAVLDYSAGGRNAANGSVTRSSCRVNRYIAAGRPPVGPDAAVVPVGSSMPRLVRMRCRLVGSTSCASAVA